MWFVYTKHSVVEGYRFFFHAFVIFEIAKLVHNRPDASSFTLPAPYRSSRCKVIVIGCKVPVSGVRKVALIARKVALVGRKSARS